MAPHHPCPGHRSGRGLMGQLPECTRRGLHHRPGSDRGVRTGRDERLPGFRSRGPPSGARTAWWRPTRMPAFVSWACSRRRRDSPYLVGPPWRDFVEPPPFEGAPRPIRIGDRIRTFFPGPRPRGRDPSGPQGRPGSCRTARIPRSHPGSTGRSDPTGPRGPSQPHGAPEPHGDRHRVRASGGRPTPGPGLPFPDSGCSRGRSSHAHRTVLLAGDHPPGGRMNEPWRSSEG